MEDMKQSKGVTSDHHDKIEFVVSQAKVGSRLMK